MAEYFFITGAARSGTTLIDKLCHNLPGVIAASQPFHQWYVDVRDRFFSARPEFREPLPLFHHFPARRGWHRAFLDYLNSTDFSQSDATTLVRKAATGKGQATPGLHIPQPAGPQSPLSLWQHLHATLAPALEHRNAKRIGSKEIYCEDYLPFFAANGIHCIISIRDIRDVITSMNFGSYREATGCPYPLLLNVRNWRKSVATALALRGSSRVTLIRYEDVVAAPAAVLARIADFLRLPVEELPDLAQLRDQQGEPWQGNSSFGSSSSVNNKSAGRWQELLPAELVKLIEYLAAPELVALGYQLTQPPVDPVAAFDAWKQADSETRADYQAGNQLDEHNLHLEMKRRAVLETGPAPDDEEWFLYPHAAESLRDAWMKVTV